MNNKNIIWLASYPKSGNTWFRIFLTNLLRDSDEPASINDLKRTPIASSRNLFDEYVGFDSSDLDADEIDLLRPEIYLKIASEAKENIYQKIHDAYIILDNGQPLIPAEASKCAIYFIRNPLDVAVSFAYHSNIDFNASIRNMNNNNYSFCSKNDRLHNQLRQKLLTWSNHVKSWTEQKEIPVLVVRYEDMIDNTFKEFKKIVDFIGIETNDKKIEKAINFSSFSELQKQEEQFGFNEKAPKSEKFFRKGKVGSWKEELTKEQVEKIIENHQIVMKKFGYL